MNRRDLMKNLIGISAAAACVTLQEKDTYLGDMRFQDKHWPRGRTAAMMDWHPSLYKDVRLGGLSGIHAPGHQS